MISIKSVLRIHQTLIDIYGGASGVRDTTLLDSAINRPYATFAGVDLYPTPNHKAAAILQSILINHPFIDGNKRTAFALLIYFLKSGNTELISNESDTYEFIISVSKGELDFDSILNWIDKNTVK